VRKGFAPKVLKSDPKKVEKVRMEPRLKFQRQISEWKKPHAFVKILLEHLFKQKLHELVSIVRFDRTYTQK